MGAKRVKDIAFFMVAMSVPVFVVGMLVLLFFHLYWGCT